MRAIVQRGYRWKNGGAWAEYVAAPEAALALKPPGLSFEQAATVPTAGIIALTNLQQGRLRSGQKVLVNGAAGGVGGLAVQIAEDAGAEVTGGTAPTSWTWSALSAPITSSTTSGRISRRETSATT